MSQPLNQLLLPNQLPPNQLPPNQLLLNLLLLPPLLPKELLLLQLKELHLPPLLKDQRLLRELLPLRPQNLTAIPLITLFQTVDTKEWLVEDQLLTKNLLISQINGVDLTTDHTRKLLVHQKDSRELSEDQTIRT